MVDVIEILPRNKREKLRVALDRYAEVDLVDVRVVVQLTETSDIWTPTKKGLSLRVEQLPGLIDALEKAEARARERGLIGGEA